MQDVGRSNATGELSVNIDVVAIDEVANSNFGGDGLSAFIDATERRFRRADRKVVDRDHASTQRTAKIVAFIQRTCERIGGKAVSQRIRDLDCVFDVIIGYDACDRAKWLGSHQHGIA